MENSVQSTYTFTYLDLFDVWVKQHTKQKREDAVYAYTLTKIGHDDLPIEYINNLKRKLENFCRYLALKWEKCHRKVSEFRKKNVEWFKGKLTIECPEKQTGASVGVIGRPRLPFCDKSDRGKRREAAELSEALCGDTGLLVCAAATSARKRGQVTLATVLKESIQSPTRPSKIKKAFSEKDKTIVKFQPDEALAHLLEYNLTKQQYCGIRQENKFRNCDIYPHYSKVAAVKSKCRPEGVVVSQKLVRVSLQSLLSHTATRIVEMQKDVINNIMIAEKKNHINADFIFSYGFDSSTGQVLYKQQHIEPSTSQESDSSLLATTVIPLRLLSSGQFLWNNRTPQSVRFCRPLKLEFAKETTEIILKEDFDIKREIKDLETVQIEIGEGKTVSIAFKLYLTVIDGKVLNILTGTKSNQSCPICGAGPKHFISISNYTSDVFRAKESNLKYGISPLHCWIRFFEFILHTGYKCEVKKWQIRTEEDKLAVATRKQTIQNGFWNKLGLHIDRPKVGGFGSTNDGNTARRAFADHEIFSEITGVDVSLIFRLKIILISLSCQFPLDLNKFQTFCFETADIILNTYSWLPMTATVHKVLIHSKQIMETSVLPVGFLGEDAAESRHKLYKADRLHHARKNSRTNNILDVFNRAMDTSDPLISSLSLNKRMQQRKRLQIPPEVIQLLICEHEERIREEQSNTDSITNDDDIIDDSDDEQDLLSQTYAYILNDLHLENELDFI